MPNGEPDRLEGGSTAMRILVRADEALFILEKFLCVVLGASMFGATLIETILRYGFGLTLLVGISDLIKWGVCVVRGHRLCGIGQAESAHLC